MDLRRVDLNLLVSLDALLSELNVTRAAQRLKLSQPALSAQLARLRHVLGDPLLIPAGAGRGMIPTARALQLRAPLHVLLHEMDTLLDSPPPFSPMTAQHVFKFAASDNAGMMIALPIAQHLRDQAGPGIRLSFRTLDQQRIAEQMESGAVDFVFGSENAILPFMKSSSLLAERWVMVQRSGHPRGIAPLTLESYCMLNHVLVSPSGGSFRGRVDEALERLGMQRHVVLSVQQFMLALAIVKATDYVAALPARFVAFHQDRIDTFELPVDAGGYRLHLAWHPRDHGNSAHQWMRKIIARSVTG